MKNRGSTSKKKRLHVKPPRTPWLPLREGDGNRFPLSFYYSDPRSVIPVRQVGRKLDNKSDPNFETQTYGLFSTCERGMRAGAVRNGMKYIFFCTNRKTGRVLTGYYKVGWYHKGPPIIGYAGEDRPPLVDYQLAASEIRFVNPGFSLGDLTGYLNGVRLDRRFRTFIYIDGGTAQRLLNLLERTEDATMVYLEEIKRLEELNKTSSSEGFAYENWKRSEGFSWEDAPKYMGLES